MNRSFVRRSVAAAVIALVSGLLAVPASADDLDEDAVAVQRCGAGAEFYDVDAMEYADRAEVALYVYGLSPDENGAPTQLCSFAIVSTDEDATLDGTWSLSVGSAARGGAVAGSTIATEAVTVPAGGNPVAVFAASGQQQAVDVDKPSAGEKRAAKKKYDLAKKKAKKVYKKAGKTKKAKKAMAKKLKKAKRSYTSAVTTTRNVTKRPYSLHLQLAIEQE